ncbi:hypothetical protein HD554DRAFT_2109591 [Boletus coccyginus]|nr:hypothetical protein HD554DRAFT_2109591 [Boletus coccyginus]
MPERQPYQGPRKLVVAFDVGIAYSSVSYSILCPGEPPVIRGVTRFPATSHVGGGSKVPSIMYYDLDGVTRAFGNEALQEYVIETAEDEEWVLVEWWRLHLRPTNMASNHVTDQDIPPLPPNKTAIQILSDFMGYLFQCTKTYIQETHPSGHAMWESFGDNIDFQTQIRRAAVLAGLVPDSPEGQARIRLVTEGEASLHFCLTTEKTAGPFKGDQGVMVIDAGGETIDVRSYYMTSSPATFQEITPAECRLEGSVFVTRRAQQFLAVKLAGSKFGTPEDIAQMTKDFDKSARLRFKNPTEPSPIRFGPRGTDVATLFEPSVKAMIEAVEKQREQATKPIGSIFLIGSFAASDWLFSKLQEHIKPMDINCCRPDSHTNKAVADGAVAFYLANRVSARVSKFTYGTRCAVEFNKNNEQHKFRAASAVPRPSGRMVLPNAFSAILNKGTAVSETEEFRKDFMMECAAGTSYDMVATEIVCYRGDASSPRWTDLEPGMFPNLCTIHADTSQVSKTLSPRRGFAGLEFYKQQFSIVLMFGLTELQAQISWMENGTERRGPATVVFDQIIEEL